jgi:hypothetical protein
MTFVANGATFTINQCTQISPQITVNTGGTLYVFSYTLTVGCYF